MAYPVAYVARRGDGRTGHPEDRVWHQSAAAIGADEAIAAQARVLVGVFAVALGLLIEAEAVPVNHALPQLSDEMIDDSAVWRSAAQ